MLALAVTATMAPAAAAAGPPAADPGTLLVRLRAPGDAGAVAAAHGARVGAAVRGTRYHVVRAAPARLPALRAALDHDRRVAAVEPNRVRALAAVPDDPFFRKSGAQTSLRTIRAPLAWDRRRASAGAVLAIVDAGVDAAHPDLAGRVLAGGNVVAGETANPTGREDANGHGTQVAGIAAAATNNKL
ncbi:MAG TPA: S8 family serine peptidase, partial [Solirubrobacteraceae bacterium]